jgi:hypothetical protein
MNSTDPLEGIDLAAFEKLRDEGCTPVEMYIYAAKSESEKFKAPMVGSSIHRIALLRKLYGLSLSEAVDILGEAHRLEPTIEISGEFYS